MSASISVPAQQRWLPGLLSGKPHQIIGEPDAPYLLRWFLLPPNRGLNLYLHHFTRSDDPRGLHDHPWDFVSLMLAGSYREVTESGAVVRHWGAVAIRRAEHRHRIELLSKPDGTSRRCWSIVLTGPRRRPWGFWCRTRNGPARFIPWQHFGHAGCDSPTHPFTAPDRRLAQ